MPAYLPAMPQNACYDPCPPRVRVCDRDVQIAELRQQLCNMRNQNHGDVRCMQEEVCNSENRFRMLSDDKVRNDCESRLIIDKTCSEVNDN